MIKLSNNGPNSLLLVFITLTASLIVFDTWKSCFKSSWSTPHKTWTCNSNTLHALRNKTHKKSKSKLQICRNTNKISNFYNYQNFLRKGFKERHLRLGRDFTAAYFLGWSWNWRRSFHIVGNHNPLPSQCQSITIIRKPNCHISKHKLNNKRRPFSAALCNTQKKIPYLSTINTNSWGKLWDCEYCWETINSFPKECYEDCH